MALMRSVVTSGGNIDEKIKGKFKNAIWKNGYTCDLQSKNREF
jgi:hypothetical protein